MRLCWQELHRLEEEFGDAFFILDLQRFQDNYREFLSAFRSIYPHTNIAYSYKTNYIPRLCQLVNSMGGYAEVVSQLEYELARRIGVVPERIVFNGPVKLEAELEKALLAGSIVNLDSMYEVSLVQALSLKFPASDIQVGLRCNIDVGAESVSRFGFDVDGGGLDQAVEILSQSENCQIQGLHCHFSSPRSVESYALRAENMLRLAAIHFQDRVPRFIDLGGGFFGKMGKELKSQFADPIPTYQDYAEAIAPQFAAAFPNGSGPELLLEPGVALVADVMKFVAKVLDVKTVRGRTVALSTGSVHNIKPTLHGKNLPLQVVCADEGSAQPGPQGPVDVVGYTCMEPDCLYKGYQGAINAGDYVVFDSVGAYTVVFKPPFIRPSPAIVAYNAGSEKYERVKRRELFEDLFQTYSF